MNHIFKIIFNRETGKTVVVSENVKSSHKTCSNNIQKIDDSSSDIKEKNSQYQGGNFPKKKLVIFTGLILSSIIPNIGFAQEIFTSSNFVQASSISTNLSNFFGKDYKGIIASDTLSNISSDNSAITLSKSDSTINLTESWRNPEFIIGAYADLASDKFKDFKSISVDSNTFTSIVGFNQQYLYVALAQYNKDIGSFCAVPQSCSSSISMDNKKITTNSNILNIFPTTYFANNSLDSGVYTARTGLKFKTDDVNTKSYSINNARGSVNWSIESSSGIGASNLTLESNSNQINIKGGKNDTQNLYAGSVITDFQSGSSTSGQLTANSTIYGKDEADGSLHSSARTQINMSNNVLSSNSNTINIDAENNDLGDLYSAYATHNIQTGNAKTDSVSLTMNSSSNVTYGIVDSAADSSAIADGTIINANKNTMTISGANNKLRDLYSAYSAINIKTGDAETSSTTNSAKKGYSNVATTAYATAKNVTLASDENQIIINGKNQSFKNVYAGYTALNIQTGKAKTSSSMNGSDTSIDVSNTQLSASKNEVNLNGSSTIKGSIYGGYIGFNLTPGEIVSDNPFASFAGKGNSNVILDGTSAVATNNIITIEGDTQIDNNASIYGGYLSHKDEYSPRNYDVFSGNTLNFNSLKPISVNTISNFQTYNFRLNPEFANTQTALINADKIVLGSNTNNLSTGILKASDIYVVGIHSGQLLDTGTKFILMQANSLTGDGKGYRSAGIAQQGISLLYDVETNIDKNNNQIIATIVSGHNEQPVEPLPPSDIGEPSTSDEVKPPSDIGEPSTSDEVKPPSDTGEPSTSDEVKPPSDIGEPSTSDEVKLPSDIGEPSTSDEAKKLLAARINPQLKALLEGNLAGLMLLTRGADDIADNLQSVISEQNKNRGLVPYVNFSGHYSRYDSGSHIKAEGGLLNAGFSFQRDQLTLGAFIESGWGSYDTYNTFKNAAKVDGEGNNRYTGIGIYGHYDFEDGFYVDGSFRGGRLRNKFNTNDLRNVATGEV